MNLPYYVSRGQSNRICIPLVGIVLLPGQEGTYASQILPRLARFCNPVYRSGFRTRRPQPSIDMSYNRGNESFTSEEGRVFLVEHGSTLQSFRPESLGVFSVRSKSRPPRSVLCNTLLLSVTDLCPIGCSLRELTPFSMVSTIDHLERSLCQVDYENQADQSVLQVCLD